MKCGQGLVCGRRNEAGERSVSMEGVYRGHNKGVRKGVITSLRDCDLIHV